MTRQGDLPAPGFSAATGKSTFTLPVDRGFDQKDHKRFIHRFYLKGTDFTEVRCQRPNDPPVDRASQGLAVMESALRGI